MEMLSFDLSGKFAHFRKYYANNTALTFAIPPGTTLMGRAAALLGLPRDSYYETLGPDHLRFGVRILSPVKKSFHRLNLLMIKGGSDFRGQKGRVQTPFEMVTGWDIKRDEVAYRIYISPVNDEVTVFEDLKRRLANNERGYNLSLGPAFCLASLSNVRLGLKAEPRTESQDFVSIHSAVPVRQVQELDMSSEKMLIEEELLPGAFLENYERELSSMHQVLFSTDGQPMRVKIEGEYLAVTHDGQTELITFLE